jgi:alkanesulfonate monooxygenase SsuD/methylene tetrahydromethanopterin reductase-like flavin-dependent oxidoreductase (luciferase family)
LKEHFRIYEDAAREVGFQPIERPVIRQVFVGATRKEAERAAEPAVSYLYRELYGAKSAQGDRELRTDDGRLITDQRQATFEALKDRFAIGEPDSVYKALARCATELGATEIICWMHMPGIRGEDAMRSVELFAKEVMPRF